MQLDSCKSVDVPRSVCVRTSYVLRSVKELPDTPSIATPSQNMPQGFSSFVTCRHHNMGQEELLADKALLFWGREAIGKMSKRTTTNREKWVVGWKCWNFVFGAGEAEL